MDNQEGQSCDITAKGSSCCSTGGSEVKDNKTHWDEAYANSPHEKLGWYETDLTPSLNLIEMTKLPAEALILNVGAGSTTLVDELLKRGYKNIVATDISEVALANLSNRISATGMQIKTVVDDLTNPVVLRDLPQVDMWVDRAVLHFFTDEKDRKTYFDLLRERVKNNGFVLMAEYNLDGATRCAGLPVYRYSKEMLQENMGDAFKLMHSFEYTYTMPHGDLRPYIYTLFRKIK